jgi:hypothetical protein
VQSPCGGRLKDHQTRAYLAALIGIVSAQLDSTHSQTDGLRGVLELLQAVPFVQDGLDGRARDLVTSLADASLAVVSAAANQLMRLSATAGPFMHSGTTSADAAVAAPGSSTEGPGHTAIAMQLSVPPDAA